MRRAVPILLLIAALAAGAVASGDPSLNTVRGVCVARGPLMVIGNEVRFSAKGVCGPIPITIAQTLGPFAYSYPTWSGGCGYGPGPFPRLRLRIQSGGPLPGWRETFWYFPDLVVGHNRAKAPYSTNRILIRDVVTDAYGRPTAEGPIVGHGVLLTRLTGSCNVTSPSEAASTVIFVLHDSPYDFEDLP